MLRKIRNRIRAIRIERMIMREIRQMRSESVAHLNLIKPLKDHLENIELRHLTRDINLSKYSDSLLRDNDNKNINSSFYENLEKYKKDLSPIPRHDLGNFNKLVTAEDLSKRQHPSQHPNPKFQSSEKFNFIFRNNLNFEQYVIYDYDQDPDNLKDDPDLLWAIF